MKIKKAVINYIHWVIGVLVYYGLYAVWLFVGSLAFVVVVGIIFSVVNFLSSLF